MSATFFNCAYCGTRTETTVSAYNRAQKIGAPLFCGCECAGAGRRIVKTEAQRKEEKRLYDAAYRAKNRKKLRREKHEYYLRTYDPAKASCVRKARMPQHIEYCRQSWYREYKRIYDARRRAAEYSNYAEAYLTFLGLQREVRSHVSAKDSKLANGTLNKAQNRRRSAGAVGGNSSVGPVGHAAGCASG